VTSTIARPDRGITAAGPLLHLWAIADRLAQPAGHWAPFRPPPLLRPAYLLGERQP